MPPTGTSRYDGASAVNGAIGRPEGLDEHRRTEHAYLTASDQCRCLAEYLPASGYRASRVNQLIVNLKCRPSIAASDPRRLHYKLRAIDEVARVLRGALSRSAVESATWIPIPPSRPARDVDYDDRLQRILTAAFGDYDLDLRGLLYQTETTAADHTRSRRLKAEALYRVIALDHEALARKPPRARIVLFDDVLTTGKHYKCCERRLREALAQIPISGLFVARRVLPRRWRCPPPFYAGATRALAVPGRPIISASAAAMMPVVPANTKAST
jgi:hypothetical protein